jgi:hypothetical protein
VSCLVAVWFWLSVGVVALLGVSGVAWWLEKNGYTGQGPGVE